MFTNQLINLPNYVPEAVIRKIPPPVSFVIKKDELKYHLMIIVSMQV
jgi:hypothetical protein